MKIVITGGSGFLGEPLVRKLLGRGEDVAVLSRDPAKVKAGRGVAWDGRSAGSWTSEMDAADAVINLAGENIGSGRWTQERRRRLVESRLQATDAIVAALVNATPRPRTLISASAVGYYGFQGENEVDESGPRGGGFLAGLSEQWESAARKAEKVARVVIFRFGVVLAGDGGALPKMMLPFRFGAGGPIGSGTQWMSWVDRDDVLSALLWALDQPAVRGVYNITSPQPVQNREFVQTLGRAMHRPSLMPAPSFALRLALGEMADEVLLGGQKAVPKRAEQEGFRFSYASLESSLRHAL